MFSCFDGNRQGERSCESELVSRWCGRRCCRDNFGNDEIFGGGGDLSRDDLEARIREIASSNAASERSRERGMNGKSPLAPATRDGNAAPCGAATESRLRGASVFWKDGAKAPAESHSCAATEGRVLAALWGQSGAISRGVDRDHRAGQQQPFGRGFGKTAIRVVPHIEHAAGMGSKRPYRIVLVLARGALAESRSGQSVKNALRDKPTRLTLDRVQGTAVDLVVVGNGQGLGFTVLENAGDLHVTAWLCKVLKSEFADSQNSRPDTTRSFGIRLLLRVPKSQGWPGCWRNRARPGLRPRGAAR